MAEIRASMRAYTLEGHGPLEVILRLDEMLRALAPPRSAALAIFALDIERERISGVSAGHLPGLLLEPDGTARFVAYASGPSLGFGLGSRYAEEEIPFGPCSSLLLYTDGLVERRASPLERGLDRLLSAATEPSARGASGGPEPTLADRVYARLAREERLEDDVALLAIESLPVGESLRFTLDTRAAHARELEAGHQSLARAPRSRRA
jgi:serine phosphatase RsbU (regulator of sigma subunit)